jgi:tRNA pseudouridine13 synthase
MIVGRSASPEPVLMTVLPAVWPRAGSVVWTDATLRSRPEDFQVHEDMPFALTGGGEHLWLRVRKRGFNTEQVARHLARAAGVAPRAVGYAGLKDRHAVTEQWFSLHLPGRPDPVWDALPAGVEVLEAVRHGRKLQRGALRGNRFEIVLRECQGDASLLAARLEVLQREGVPNYFGEQRFGHDRDNVARARAMFANDEPVRDRHRRGLYLSAARAWLFNEVLATRIRDGNWQTALAGEACILAGSHSFFVADAADETLRRRLVEHDIHLSGPMWGAGDVPTRAAVAELERAVVAQHADLAAGLEREGLRQERRALRVIPQNLEAVAINPGDWRLRFSLPAGSYATAVLRELADYHSAGHELSEDDPS